MKNLSEDHKEIQSGKKLDDEGYMAKVEMDKIEQSLEKLRKIIKKSNHNLPSWVQSKITKSSDYLDIVADYLASDVKMDENASFTINKERHKEEGTKHRRTSKVEKAPTSSQEQLPNIKKLGPRLPKFEEASLVDKILSEMLGDKPGIDIKKTKSLDKIAKKHNVSVEYLEKQLKKGIKIEMEHTTDKGEAEIIALHHLEEIPDYYTRLNKMEKSTEVKEAKKYMTKDEDPCWKGYEMVGFKKKKGKKVPNCVPVSEATTRLPMQTGQLLRVLVNWRGKHLSVQMFFPQLGTPKRNEIAYAVNQIYPEARVISYVPCEMDSSTPIVQVKEENELFEFKKSEMDCNKPKAQPVGDSLTGKSHVVKACEGGEERVFRFGQRGVKGSPKKEGESEEYKNRRLRFKKRHKKNIRKGKMSAAYWANKVKW
jgi:hypothetical protein